MPLLLSGGKELTVVDRTKAVTQYFVEISFKGNIAASPLLKLLNNGVRCHNLKATNVLSGSIFKNNTTNNPRYQKINNTVMKFFLLRWVFCAILSLYPII